MSERFLAIDLGAESGRVMLGALESDRLTLTDLRRFPNRPVRDATSVRWDAPGLWREISAGLDAAAATGPVEGIGVDTWGCDFALVDGRGQLLENPYTYRDTRTDGVADQVHARVGREALYARTGSQLLPFNTLFQVHAACRRTPGVIRQAGALLLMPDLFNFWLTGVMRTEYTIASTTQMVDPRARDWAGPLLEELELPRSLLQPIVEPGTILGPLRAEACAALAGARVVAPACHDTGSAFAAIGANERGAVLSSGTWSLLGAERPSPMVTDRARELNFTNEGGVCGTTRVLKNITGLWLLQSCMRAWTAAGKVLTHDALLSAAASEAQPFRSLADPDHTGFFYPDDMLAALAAFCRRTRQPEPETPAAVTRTILESLAFKYRLVLEWLEEVTGVRYDRLRIVGGGSRNRLLCQFTADAIGRPVVAGPVEATALGNVAMQMVATGVVPSLDKARDIIDRSFPGERYEPMETGLWDREYPRFLEYVKSHA